MNLRHRRRSIFTLLGAVSVLLIGGALFSRTRAQEERETREVAPGISLLSVSTQTLNGPLRYWLVTADKTRSKLALQVADERDAIKKRTVRDLAARSKALVAVNGGFFAYGGAAVGAVKTDGVWQRLPWKSRTALAWNDQTAQIGALSGSCNLKLDFADGTTKVVPAALNGFALPGSHAALTNGFCVLTSNFAPKYKLKSGEVAAFTLATATFTDGNSKVVPLMTSVSSGEVTIPLNGFIVVARGAAISQLQSAAPSNANITNQNATPPNIAAPNAATPNATTPNAANAQLAAPIIIPRLSFSVATTPANWNNFPNILGAGPLLIENGAVKTTEVAEEFLPDVLERGPRTALGFDAKGNTLILVADGRQAASSGLTIPETAQLLRSFGAVSALNFDGGSSTQLVIGGVLVNAPSGYDPVNPLVAREVQVSNALVVQTR